MTWWMRRWNGRQNRLTFRDRMRTSYSKAHDDLMKALLKQPQPVKMDVDEGQCVIHLTTSDLYIHPTAKAPRGLHVFVDGQPHLKYRQEEKDERINQILVSRRIPFLRLPYTRVSKRLVKEWVETIMEMIY